MTRRAWVQILAKYVIVGALGKSISTAPSYQGCKKWYSEGSEGIVKLSSSVRQCTARLYAPRGVEMESGMDRPNDLG